jgi:hypothetical protein
MTATFRIAATVALTAFAFGATACTQQEAAPAAPAPAAAPVETRTVVETREVPVAVPVPVAPPTVVVERDRPADTTTVRAGRDGIEVETTRPN